MHLSLPLLQYCILQSYFYIGNIDLRITCRWGGERHREHHGSLPGISWMLQEGKHKIIVQVGASLDLKKSIGYATPWRVGCRTAERLKEICKSSHLPYVWNIPQNRVQGGVGRWTRARL